MSVHTRSPIIAVLGHVDHGKTSLLDAIRGTGIASREAGGITQMIGASYVSREAIEKISEPVAGVMKISLVIPGILFIDTPGHEAFSNLRERGGGIADMAILVVDLMQGVQPQTEESLRILKASKTPFVIAATKADLVQGWKGNKTESFLESLKTQPPHVVEALDNRIYTLAGQMAERGFDSDRFDRVQDFTKNVAIIPVSSKTREGLAELLLLIAGLGQKFLGHELEIGENMPAKGSIIEVKSEEGLGAVVDVILYEGILSEGDDIAFLTRNGAMKSKVRALLEPSIRGGKEKHTRIKSVAAAAGVRISAPGLEDALGGSPLISPRDFEKEKAELEAQAKSIIFESSDLGVIAKADSLGSLEVLIKLLGGAGIAVKAADVGPVAKQDILIATNVASQDRYLGVVVGFNVEILAEATTLAEASKIPVISNNIVYRIIENYEKWKTDEREREKNEALESLPWPCAVRAIPGCFFHASKPAIFGVEVLAGKLRTHARIMKRGVYAPLGEIKSVQKEKESVEKAERGDQVAISVEGPVLGNDIREGDVLLVVMGKEDIIAWRKSMDALNDEEKRILAEIEDIIMVHI
jgi:translation initiation factor 5B